MSGDFEPPRTRGPGPRFGDGTDPQPRTPYPDWREPPIPSGPRDQTPSGAVTRNGGGGYSSAQLVTTGHRVPILYGRLAISPDIVQIGSVSGGNTPEFAVVISEGPIDAVESWGGGMGTPTVSLGSLSPTSGLPSWSIGLACAVGSQDGSPYAPTCIARGRKPYDPRLGAWGAGEYPDSAKTAYSTNPALIMADLLTFPQYGLGVAPTAVDWGSVEDAADWCDTLVSGTKRYEIAGLHLREGGSSEDWMATVGLHAGLRWRQAEGLWTLDYPDASAAVDATITDDDLLDDDRPSVRYGAGTGLAGLPNRFVAEYTSASDWTLQTTPYDRPEVADGAPIRAAATYRLHGFQTEVMAKRALERIADEIWSEVEVDLPLPLDFLHLNVGSRVTLNTPSIGFVGIDFRITRLAYDSDRIRATATLFNAETWDAATEEELASPAPVGAEDPLQGALPSPPPPAPVAAPTAPAVLAPPAVGLVPLYRALDADLADGDPLAWDAATRTVVAGTGGGGGGAALTLKEDDGSPSVSDVVEIRFSGATVEEVSAGIVKVTVPTGGGSGTSPVLATDAFVATASQTAFILSHAPVADGIVYVSRDGVVARAGDWTLGGSTVTFGTGLDAGVEVQVGYWRTAPDGASPAFDGFVATGGQTDFALSHTASAALVVARGGVVQSSTAWSITGGGTTLSFTSGLVAGDDVWIAYLY